MEISRHGYCYSFCSVINIETSGGWYESSYKFELQGEHAATEQPLSIISNSTEGQVPCNGSGGGVSAFCRITLIGKRSVLKTDVALKSDGGSSPLSGAKGSSIFPR